MMVAIRANVYPVGAYNELLGKIFTKVLICKYELKFKIPS